MPIRPATADDIPTLIAIYNQAVAGGHATAHTSGIDPASDTFLKPTESHPVFLEHDATTIRGWCALRPYRPGRQALAATAEIAYYIDRGHRRHGIATRLLRQTVAACPSLGISSLLAIVLDINLPSIAVLEKHGFTRWGHLPGIARMGDGTTAGQFIYGLHT